MKNKLYNIFNIIKDNLVNNTKYRKYYIGIILVLLIILIVIINTIINSINDNPITYNEIETIIKNKDSAIIYYYNNLSSNINNRKIKRYLDKKDIKYYTYNDRKIDKKEYNKFLKLLKIDKKLFSCPSLIYIKDGKMYGNLINIDNKDVVKEFIDNYDLYIVK